jgi:hypothetical protein
MKRYRVYVPVHAGYSVVVDAEDPEHAIEKAYDQGEPTICHQCSDVVEICGLGDIDPENVIEVQRGEDS